MGVQSFMSDHGMSGRRTCKASGLACVAFAKIMAFQIYLSRAPSRFALGAETTRSGFTDLSIKRIYGIGSE
jgi:hypothetical protein